MSHKKLTMPVPEPHYIPGYTGHCARLREDIGNNYSMATHRVLAHPSSYDMSPSALSVSHRSEVRNQQERNTFGPEGRKNSRDATESPCRSYLQQASELLKSPLCQKLCCKKCSEEEEKCRANCFKGEMQPRKASSTSNSTPTPCSHCCELIKDKLQPASTPTMVHRRSSKICNKVNCKYSSPDKRSEVAPDSKCPCFNNDASNNSTTPQFKDEINPTKALQTACEKYGCPCACCKLS